MTMLHKVIAKVTTFNRIELPVVNRNISFPLQDAISVASTVNPWETDLKVSVGVCAMAKKSGSKPMKEILSRLSKFECILPEVFPEEMILNEPVENWPTCDCLVSFFSTGFPLKKAIAYADLRKPLIINDLEAQFTLMDRYFQVCICCELQFGLCLVTNKNLI